MKSLKHFLIISIIFLSLLFFKPFNVKAYNDTNVYFTYDYTQFKNYLLYHDTDNKIEEVKVLCNSIFDEYMITTGNNHNQNSSGIVYYCYDISNFSEMYYYNTTTTNSRRYLSGVGTSGLSYAVINRDSSNNLTLSNVYSDSLQLLYKTSVSDVSNINLWTSGSSALIKVPLYSSKKLYYKDYNSNTAHFYIDNVEVKDGDLINFYYDYSSSTKTNFYVTHSCSSAFQDYNCKVDEVDIIFQHDFSGNDYVLKVYSEDNTISNSYIFSRGNILNNVYSKQLIFRNNVSNINYQVYELVPIYDTSNNVIDYEEVLISEILNDSVSHLLSDNLSIDIVIDKYIHNDINNKPLRDIHLYYNVNLYENRYKFYYKLSCVGISNDYNCNAVKDYEFEATSNIYKFSINNEHKYNRVEAYIKDTFTGEIVSSEYLNFSQLIVPVVELEQAYGSNGKVDIKLKFNNIIEDDQYYFDLKYGGNVLISKQFLNVSDNNIDYYTNSILGGQVLSISIHDVNGNQVVYYDFDIESYENIKITNNDSIFKFMTKYLNKRSDKIDKLGDSLQEAFDTIPDDIEQALLFFLIVICIMTTLMLGGL